MKKLGKVLRWRLAGIGVLLALTSVFVSTPVALAYAIDHDKHITFEVRGDSGGWTATVTARGNEVYDLDIEGPGVSKNMWVEDLKGSRSLTVRGKGSGRIAGFGWSHVRGTVERSEIPEHICDKGAWTCWW